MEWSKQYHRKTASENKNYDFEEDSGVSDGEHYRHTADMLCFVILCHIMLTLHCYVTLTDTYVPKTLEKAT